MGNLTFGRSDGSDLRVGQIRMAHLSHRVDEEALRTGRGAVKVEVMRIVGTMVTVKIVKTGTIIRIDKRGFRPMAEKKAMELKVNELVSKFNGARA